MWVIFVTFWQINFKIDNMSKSAAWLIVNFIIMFRWINTLYTGTLANSVNPDEMPQNEAFYMGNNVCLPGTEAYSNLESQTCDPLMYKNPSRIHYFKEFP